MQKNEKRDALLREKLVEGKEEMRIELGRKKLIKRRKTERKKEKEKGKGC